MAVGCFLPLAHAGTGSILEALVVAKLSFLGGGILTGLYQGLRNKTRVDNDRPIETLVPAEAQTGVGVDLDYGSNPVDVNFDEPSGLDYHDDSYYDYDYDLNPDLDNDADFLDQQVSTSDYEVDFGSDSSTGAAAGPIGLPDSTNIDSFVPTAPGTAVSLDLNSVNSVSSSPGGSGTFNIPTDPSGSGSNDYSTDSDFTDYSDDYQVEFNPYGSPVDSTDTVSASSSDFGSPSNSQDSASISFNNRNDNSAVDYTTNSDGTSNFADYGAFSDYQENEEPSAFVNNVELFSTDGIVPSADAVEDISLPFVPIVPNLAIFNNTKQDHGTQQHTINHTNQIPDYTGRVTEEPGIDLGNIISGINPFLLPTEEPPIYQSVLSNVDPELLPDNPEYFPTAESQDNPNPKYGLGDPIVANSDTVDERPPVPTTTTTTPSPTTTPAPLKPHGTPSQTTTWIIPIVSSARSNVQQANLLTSYRSSHRSPTNFHFDQRVLAGKTINSQSAQSRVSQSFSSPLQNVNLGNRQAKSNQNPILANSQMKPSRRSQTRIIDGRTPTNRREQSNLGRQNTNTNSNHNQRQTQNIRTTSSGKTTNRRRGDVRVTPRNNANTMQNVRQIDTSHSNINKPRRGIQDTEKQNQNRKQPVSERKNANRQFTVPRRPSESNTSVQTKLLSQNVRERNPSSTRPVQRLSQNHAPALNARNNNQQQRTRINNARRRIPNADRVSPNSQNAKMNPRTQPQRKNLASVPRPINQPESSDTNLQAIIGSQFPQLNKRQAAQMQMHLRSVLRKRKMAANRRRS